MTRAPALLLDRDGVINVDHGYVCDIAHFDFMPGIFSLCRAFHQRGYRLVVVTNQSGIGRGLFREEQLAALHEWMRRRFQAEEAPLQGIYWCGHHPTAGQGAWRRACDCRKPEPGLMRQAANELGLDLARSLSIGDRERDMLAGQRAGVGRNLLLAPAAPTNALPTQTAATARITQLHQALSYLDATDPHDCAQGSLP